MRGAPQVVLETICLDFHDRLTSAEVESAISDLARRIYSAQPEVKRVFIEAPACLGHRGNL